jgi:hypothetical protein
LKRPAAAHDGQDLDPRVADALRHAIAAQEALPNRSVRELGNDAPDQRLFGGRLGQRECFVDDSSGMEGRIPADVLGDGFEIIERPDWPRGSAAE